MISTMATDMPVRTEINPAARASPIQVAASSHVFKENTSFSRKVKVALKKLLPETPRDSGRSY
jgi:hypothetical protein